MWRSFCPTGLEHLSSWAMSGIVVLALLSGGIIIIMAAVCLQRATSKRYDFDDITVPANGSLCHEHHNVEMNEVSKDAVHNVLLDKIEQSHDNQYKKCDGKDRRLMLNEYQHSLLEPPSENDREQLIQSKRSSSENYSDDYGPNTQNTDLSPYPGYESGSSLKNISVSDQYGNAEFLSFKANGLLVPENVSNSSPRRHLEDGFHLSGNSLVYSDSDSGGEDERFKVTSLDRKRQPPSFLKSSNSHNGAIGGDTTMFGDFQPTPPPYTSTMKSMKVMVDKGPCNQANFV
ncbi:uncharacterized protein LOC132759724 [Ruditapes philippinarum]|uniref:uncharacterized protein LOC132759724 n=1 Tax=Ruditapes philippinarum TaxID=129788 RepID=UPI00295BA8D9|nr:uncharacterized protein LOC132759724 [Ruditapes philippinarum]